MTFPFDSLISEHRELGLVAGVLIGFAFGFVLERAGFGRAQKLVAQFYLSDLTVFKVMFGAIVTAMLGLVALSGLKLLDLGALADAASSPTFLWPMVAGGFVLGAGFIISGYCPGTSVVAAASGKLDGAVTVVGVIAGTVVYSEVQALIEPFHLAGNFGHLYLYRLLHLPPAVLAMGVATMAAAAFLGAEVLERRFGKSPAEGPPPTAAPLRPRRITFATFAGLSVLGLATLALPASTSASPRAEPAAISPGELARRLLDEPWKVRVLDLRPMAECAARRIPGSECVPLEGLDQAGLATAPASTDLVLVTGGGQSEPLPVAGTPARLMQLTGGFEAWARYALEAPATPDPRAGPAALDEHLFRLALRSALTGAAQAPPPPPPTLSAPAGKKKGGGGGCQ